MSRFYSRVLAMGNWGVNSVPAFTYNLTDKKWFNWAKKRGKLPGFKALRGFDEEADQKNSGGALVMESKPIFPSAWNQKTAWTGTQSTYLENFFNAFGTNRSGLAYWQDKRGTTAAFQSTFSIPENGAFTWRLVAFESDDKATTGTQPRARNGVRFGAGNALWQLQLIDGQFEIARLSANWTQTKEDQLHALLDKETPTQSEQGQINALRGPILREESGTIYPDAIYEQVESLSLGNAVKRDAGNYYEIEVRPEPNGKINCTLTGSKTQSIDVPEVLWTRKPGIITNAGKLTVFTNGAPMMWQTGYPASVPKAEFVIGPMKTAHFVDSLGDFTKSILADTSLPGTNVTIELEEINGVLFQFRVTATATDPRFTPFIYGLQANLTAKPRNIDLGVALDTSTKLDEQGNPPILDIVPECEGAMRRAQYAVTMRDPGGKVFNSLADSREALENRVCTLSMGAALDKLTPLISRGIIKSATLHDMGWARKVLSRLFNTLDSTTVTLTICDAWALLDEDIMQDAPAGDGMRLGAYLRLLLLNAGFTTDDIQGIPENAGRILPKGALGEGFCIVPDVNQTRGDYLRQLVDRWGMGEILFFDNVAQNGIWKFGKRNVQLQKLRVYTSEYAYVEHDLKFSSDAALNDSKSYPGRFARLGSLDLIRDFEEHFNHFRVEGAVDPKTGQRFVAEWTAPNVIGRRKSYPTVIDEGLRSLDDVQWVLRSLVERYGRSGKFVQFSTYFHAGLMVGDLIEVDDVPCEIVQIPNGSMEHDDMEITAQELLAA
jgi:hypothetical protein